MNFDFPTILTLAVAVSGVIWGIDAALFAPKRLLADPEPRMAALPLEWLDAR